MGGARATWSRCRDSTGAARCNLRAPVDARPVTAPTGAPAGRPQGARRQHPLRHLPRAGPLAAPAGHRRGRRDARPAPQHRAPPPRADARGRACSRSRADARGGRGPAPAPLLAGARRPVARPRAADVPACWPACCCAWPAPPARAPTRPATPGGSRARPTASRYARGRRRTLPSAALVEPGSPPSGSTPPWPRTATTPPSRFAHCPFRELAEANPDLVCGLHRGPRRGLRRRASAAAEVVGFGTLVDRDACRVDLACRRRPVSRCRWPADSIDGAPDA